MSKAVKLNLKPTFDFTLIGIVTSEPIYRISYLINELLETQLKEHDPIKIYHQKRNIYQAFELFNFLNEETLECYDLIQNKGNQGLLIEEQKQTDFWLKIENSNKTTEEILTKLKSIKNISLAFDIKPDSLKSKNRLIFSLEDN